MEDLTLAHRHHPASPMVLKAEPKQDFFRLWWQEDTVWALRKTFCGKAIPINHNLEHPCFNWELTLENALMQSNLKGESLKGELEQLYDSLTVGSRLAGMMRIPLTVLKESPLNDPKGLEDWFIKKGSRQNVKVHIEHLEQSEEPMILLCLSRRTITGSCLSSEELYHTLSIILAEAKANDCFQEDVSDWTIEEIEPLTSNLFVWVMFGLSSWACAQEMGGILRNIPGIYPLSAPKKQIIWYLLTGNAPEVILAELTFNPWESEI